jgi:hypothetical protein
VCLTIFGIEGTKGTELSEGKEQIKQLVKVQIFDMYGEIVEGLILDEILKSKIQR